MTEMKKPRSAFSMIEILVVVAILCVLAAFLIPRYAGGKDPLSGKRVAAPKDRAKAVAGASYAGQINQAIQMYKMDHDDQPPPSLLELKKYGVVDEMLLDPVSRKPLTYDPQTGQLGPASLR